MTNINANNAIIQKLTLGGTDVSSVSTDGSNNSALATVSAVKTLIDTMTISKKLIAKISESGELNNIIQDLANNQLSNLEVPATEVFTRLGVSKMLTSVDSANDVVTSGFYSVANARDLPVGVRAGQLIVSRAKGSTVMQILGDAATNIIYSRSGNPPEAGGSGMWGEWTTINESTKSNIQQSISSDRSSIIMTNGIWYDYPDLSVTITPTSVNSKIEITFRWFYESTSIGGHAIHTKILRNGKDFNIGDNGGNRSLILAGAQEEFHSFNADSTPVIGSVTTLDSPNTTDPVTYKPQISTINNGTMYFNRTVGDSDSQGYERGSSELIAEEKVL